MPASDPEFKLDTKQWIDELDPINVVDIGAGLGTYYKLARKDGQHWTAVEIFEPYVTDYGLRDLYDEVIISDVRYVAEQYIISDLTIAGDIIEHLTYDDAVEVIDKLKRTSKHLIISLPIIEYKQGAEFGNIHETHLHTWNDEMMKQLLGDSLIKSKAGKILGVYLVKGEL